MKNTINTYCCILLFILFAPGLTAQSIPSELPHSKPSDLVHQYMLQHPNENYVIQTDRDLYFSGTDLWFSIWSLDDKTLSPFSYSGIVYIELMDKDGESMVQQTLKLENFKASGNIVLPEDLNSGTYYLRAYSNVQRNFGEHLFGMKIMQVINPAKPPELFVANNQSKPLVSVYPEGQKLLNGVMNKLVVKATYPNGLDAGLTDGFLIRQPNDTIAQLDFLIPGMGYCSFFADTSHRYHLDLPDIGIIPLEIQDNGFSLNIQKELKQLKLSVLGKDISDTGKHYLVGKTRGEVFFERVIEEDMEEVIFPFSTLPDGLLEFSILNSGFQETCQRLYYHDISPNLLSADIIFSKSTFKKGEAIDLEIILPEEKEFVLLSLSIRKDLFIDRSQNLDFKSCVDLHPFLNDWDEFGQMIHAVPADNFADIMNIYLITRKSSRFIWQNIFQDFPEQLEFKPEGHNKRVTAYAYNPVNSQRIKNENLALYFVGKEATRLNAATDNEGIFSFEYPAHKMGRSDIVVKAAGINEGIGISFDWPYHQSSNKYNLDYFYFDSSRFDDYDKAYTQSLLEKIYRNSQKPLPMNGDKDIAFYGVPDSRKYLEDYVSMKNMEEVFKEIVPGEKIRLLKDEYSIELYHREKYIILGDKPLVLFNGAPVLDIKEMLDLPVSRVDFVDMVRQHFLVQDQLFDGILNVVAKDLNLQLKIPPNTFKTALDVFPLESQFSMDQENKEASIPNLNPTLYWNPDLGFKGNSRRITLKAGDNPGRYQVLLRGVDADGEVLELIKYIIIE